MSLITIDQLLESVELDFEPRWVTKDAGGVISVWRSKPKQYRRQKYWASSYFNVNMESFGPLKLSEFDGKDWTECIYEVPRKEEPKNKIKIGTLYIDKGVTFGDGDDDDVGFALEDYEVHQKTTREIEKLQPTVRGFDEKPSMPTATDFLNKINELVDAINELKGAKID